MKIKDDIYILGIESSCDETSVSVVKNGRDVLSNVISSQIDIHKLYGGVVPEIASRKHIENIDIIYKESLKQAKLSIEDISAIAVTYGPGLVGSLLVGLSFAKGLSISSKIPFIGINHIEGHIASNYISNSDLEPPFISLIVSGGHTNLVKVESYNSFKIYGKTHDDACGEAYDKIARVLGFEYPGGPKLEKAALNGTQNKFSFPRGEVRGSIYDFTYSGLKSHVINVIHNIKQKNNESIDNQTISDISLEFQNSIIDSLVNRTISLSKELKINKVAICGGVSANSAIKTALKNECDKNNIKFFYPENIYCTDNAAMIASAGYYEFINGKRSKLDLNADANLEFTDK
ncbi:MAG: tRNA (adenosine(37)-N6)-threonylcarbamoyltransferase complex transferase subunit TsaD [Lachnospiraceae bacterium]|nr:tRNA (adenosine(37)-N6)-threonylcarbamoyltransferase complex transferase subunit TsaD [Lachnospiraceae bacterium]